MLTYQNAPLAVANRPVTFPPKLLFALTRETPGYQGPALRISLDGTLTNYQDLFFGSNGLPDYGSLPVQDYPVISWFSQGSIAGVMAAAPNPSLMPVLTPAGQLRFGLTEFPAQLRYDQHAIAAETLRFNLSVTATADTLIKVGANSWNFRLWENGSTNGGANSSGIVLTHNNRNDLNITSLRAVINAYSKLLVRNYIPLQLTTAAYAATLVGQAHRVTFSQLDQELFRCKDNLGNQAQNRPGGASNFFPHRFMPESIIGRGYAGSISRVAFD